MSDYSTYEEELSKHGKIIHTNVGVSMMPLLRQHRDVMIIERPNGRLKKYDCPLYKTRSGKYILHRIIKVRENDYVICGDNCVTFERGVTDKQILGVLTGVIRDGKTITMDNKLYKLYYHLWCDFIYIRIAILHIIRFTKRIFNLPKRFFRLVKRLKGKK
ncbi:MAG: S24/S26 family peptidase [Clostridia bacterium]|nr:S24/S26 family peptidase [Clostridia bacterium]MBO5102034.1 S24/S26 family peptidase [Clostridia bacterium]MBO5316144.1 S24/S26 family peptidase [Clostridia bacterium]